jgi:membrane-associated phospholipid phosphatase
MAGDTAPSSPVRPLSSPGASLALPRRLIRPLFSALAAACLVAVAMHFDQQIRLAWEGLAGGSQFAFFVAFVLTDYLKVVPVALSLLLLWRLDRRLPRNFVAVAAWVMVTQGCLTSVVKTLAGRVRPCDGGGVTVFTGFCLHGNHSFPSGHAAGAFALAALLCAYYPRWRWAFVSFAVAVALARLQLDRHFASDLVAGAFLGWFWAQWMMAWRRAARRPKNGTRPAVAPAAEGFLPAPQQ